MPPKLLLRICSSRIRQKWLGLPGVCRRLCRCPSCGIPGSSLLPREAVASLEDSTGLPVGLPGVAPWPHLHQWCVCNSGVGRLLNLSELLLPIWTKGTILLLSKGCQLQIGTCRGHRPSTLYELNHVLPQLLTFNAPRKELRMENRNEVLCAGGDVDWQNKSSDRYFQEPIL